MRNLLLILILAAPTVGFTDTTILSNGPGYKSYLGPNEALVSPSGNVKLVMQSDGNVVMYLTACTPSSRNNCSIWNGKTAQANGSYYLNMQGDGNLVAYRGTHPKGTNDEAVWQSGSARSQGNYYVTLQDDENLVIYSGTGPLDNQGAIWSRKYGLVKRDTSRIELGWMAVPQPCTKLALNQGYNLKLTTAEQRLYVYAYVDKQKFNAAKTDVEQCAVEAVGVCAIASLLAGPSGCATTFKAHMANCLSNRHVESSFINSIDISGESRCVW